MTAPAITVENLGKQYQLGLREQQNRTFREALVDTITSPYRRMRQLAGHEEDGRFWALKDISFEVQPGEVIGIIGRNGAGKSTLLKILSQITEPTEGRAIIRGRVASLLEVGTGFHNELTGRENVYLNGAILGMTRREIDRKFDEIVDFSGVEKFLDTPIKRYSSGMKVRLAFAVAAHLDPEILIIDEVLAVGDAEFQKRCLGKMRDVATGGRTVLFVSHNMGAIGDLCDRGMLLEAGLLAFTGKPSDLVSRYLAAFTAPKTALARTRTFKIPPGERITSPRSVQLLNEQGDETNTYTQANEIHIVVTFSLLEVTRTLHLSAILRTDSGITVLKTNTWDGHSLEREVPLQPGEFRSICIIPRHFLNAGSYQVDVNAQIPNLTYEFSMREPLTFGVQAIGGFGGSKDAKQPGIVRPLLAWSTSTQDTATIPVKPPAGEHDPAGTRQCPR